MFVGYDQFDTQATVLAMIKHERLAQDVAEGDEVEVVLDRTPFYAEGGGQVGDQGVLTGPEGTINIKQTIKPTPELFVHQGVVTRGRIRQGDVVHASLDLPLRLAAARNPPALTAACALREVRDPCQAVRLLVAPNRLRFEILAHFFPAAAYTQLEEVEALVNERIA